MAKWLVAEEAHTQTNLTTDVTLAVTTREQLTDHTLSATDTFCRLCCLGGCTDVTELTGRSAAIGGVCEAISAAIDHPIHSQNATLKLPEVRISALEQQRSGLF